jgi:hypothetical protein
MNDDDNENPAYLTFEAILHVRVKAHSKMGAAGKLNVMFVSSAVGLRDYRIEDLHVVEDDLT